MTDHTEVESIGDGMIFQGGDDLTIRQTCSLSVIDYVFT